MSSPISTTNSDFVIPCPDTPWLPVKHISGSMDGRFPVHRVYCVGRNYADHAIEMGHDPDRDDPFFFQKNPDNLLYSTDKFPYPSASDNVHHEVELVVALKSGGTNILIADAYTHVFGYAVGLDMTRRDLQGEAKKAGRPWETGKAFEFSAPCSWITPVEQFVNVDHAEISLSINGQLRQHGNLNQMIWKIPEMISYLSSLFTLRPGDLIFTGTPAGVGPVNRGDHMEANITGLDQLKMTVV